MQRTHIFLPEPDRARLRDLASRLDLSVGEIVRRAVDEYLTRVSTDLTPLARKEAAK